MLKSHKPNLVPEQDFHKKIASDNETKLPPQVSIYLLLVFIDFICIEFRSKRMKKSLQVKYPRLFQTAEMIKSKLKNLSNWKNQKQYLRKLRSLK